MLIVSCSRSNYKTMQQPRWQLRRSAIRRLSSATSPNKDHPVDRRNVTREFKIPRYRRRRKCRFKVNLRPYDRVVIISTRLLCQMQANSSGAESLATISKFRRKWKRKFRRHLSMSSLKRETRLFHVVVVQWWQKMYKKKALCKCRVVVCPSNLLPFWRSFCCCCRRILNSLLYVYFGAFIRRQTIKKL